MQTEYKQDERGTVYGPDGREYILLPVSDSGSDWAVAQLPDGSGYRHFKGHAPEVFHDVNAAMDDCI